MYNIINLMKIGDTMSYESERYNMDKLSNQSLSVVECGLQICHSGHTSGRRVYSDYSVTFILEGKGTYFVNGKTYELEAGQGFLITPNVPNIYIADEKEPWRYIYAIFKGIDATTLVHNAGFDDVNVIFSFPLTDEFIRNLKNMHAAGRDYLSKGYDILGYFFLAMSHIVKANSEKMQNDLSAGKYINFARFYIEDHMAYNISVEDVANYVKIDRTHLYRLFMKHLGISPSKYLENVRMRRAIDLMEYDNLSFDEIALSSGFHDFSHFSKIFKKNFGISPGKYRQEKERRGE